ncbi:hypothetical protein [Fimbriiglobus ruber]|uniref:Uncharacterized protein n=1 Tax=Fimbriiglobus ruber TaxID=1908690 RepID=A0A225E1Q5_9BACT|nr:hypothetical protein [Fimbriiglobus ruber]OWK45714.1 hypothetical protein FRUB_02045 [Fimbriiglobus ruber]
MLSCPLNQSPLAWQEPSHATDVSVRPRVRGGSALLGAGHSAEPAPKPTDPWAGTYIKGTLFFVGKAEQEQLTITKGADGYYLSKPFDGRKFTEVEKGVLSDGNGGFGKIVAGSATFADGSRIRILRADFCYEQFILYDERNAAAQADVQGK